MSNIYQYNTANNVLLIVGILSTIVPTYIGIKGKNRSGSLLYALVGFWAGPVWALTVYKFRLSDNLDVALFWNKMIYGTSVFIGISYFFFSQVFPVKRKFKIWELFVSIILPLFILVELVFTNNFVREIKLNDIGNSIEIGFVYYIWMLWLSGIMVLGVARLIREYLKLKGIVREQIKYIVIGAIFPSFGTLPTNAFLPVLGIYKYIWVGPIFMIIMHLIVAYGLTRTQFTKLTSILKRLVEFLTWIGVFFLLIFGVLYFATQYNLGMSLNIYWILLAVLMTILVRCLLPRIIKVFTFFSNENYPMFVNEFISKTSYELDIVRISAILNDVVYNASRLKSLGIVLIDSSTGSVVFNDSECKNKKEMLSFVHDLDMYWNIFSENKPILTRELRFFVSQGGELSGSQSFNRIITILEVLKKRGISIVLPVKGGRKMVGYYFLSEKERPDVVAVDEIKFLQTIVKSASIVFSRAYLYKDVQDFNENLKQKVDDATIKIREKMEKMAEMREREKNMIDIMGHELRTPLSIIKNGTSMINYYLKKNNKNFDEFVQTQYLNIEEALSREIKLIEKMLSATKIESAKLHLETGPVNLVKILKTTDVAFKSLAENKGIKLKLLYDKRKKYIVLADEVRLQEVVDNLVSNAVKYTLEGEVIVSLLESEKSIKVEVRDTGIGMTEETIKRLGKKFYRANQYIAKGKPDTVEVVRPGGTGLGLYITFGLVTAMGSKVHVKSEKGRGSVFSFSLKRSK